MGYKYPNRKICEMNIWSLIQWWKSIEWSVKELCSEEDVWAEEGGGKAKLDETAH
jgi:hypothetical protein